MALNLAGSNEDENSASGSVTLKGRFSIDLGGAIPAYDVAPCIAYNASVNADRGKAVMALICDPMLPLRVDKIMPIRSLETRMMLKPQEWGVIDWTSEGRRCPVVVIDRPNGGRVMPSLDATMRPIHEDTVSRLLIRPGGEFLELLANNNLTHRAIRPDNIFYADADQSRMVLGDCVSAPPAIAQPTVFETIESGMSLPAGRGDGSSLNDLYSLGVSILTLLIGHVPLAGMTDDQVIQEKLTHGSYNALVGREGLSLTMMEVLRGLLHDDPKERWTVSDLIFWSHGRRQNPKPQAIPRKANRPFVFDGEEYQTTRELANGFANNWDAAITPIKDGSLNVWLRRGFSDEELIENVNFAMTGPVAIDRSDDWMVSRVCIALDPQAPIRYRELRATVEGLGALIGSYLDDENMRDLFGKTLREKLPGFWQQNQRRLTEVEEKFVGDYEHARSNVDRIGLGLGIERVAYDLNPNLPCRSPIFETDYLVEVDGMLPALQFIAVSTGELKSLVDRNGAAFLASKMARQVTADLRDLDNKVDPHVSLIAAVKILATIQDRVSKHDFVDLSGVIASMLEPSIKRFHSRSIRKRVRDGLKKATRTGRLSRLVEAVNDPRDVAADANAFQQAVAVYSQTVMEDQRLEYEKAHRDYFAREMGAQMSSTVSGFITCVASVLIVIAMMFF
jgi:hypothetical protein